MLRATGNVLGLISTALLLAGAASATEITGTYMEARTCQVYTGPCFANGEVGLTGKNAVMTWSIEKGTADNVDLAGLSVAVMLRASNTLGFNGLKDAKSSKSVIVVDKHANSRQREALVAFAKKQLGKAAVGVANVKSAGIEMKLDTVQLTGTLDIEKLVHLKSRKARPGDCICSNESAYYPPLAKLDGSVPAVTIDGEVSAREIGSRWSIPDTRTSYLGTFKYN